jgi:hypothetical protein
MNTKLPNLCEGCGCDQQEKLSKLKSQIKAKYLGSVDSEEKPNTPVTEYVNSIIDVNLSSLIGKKALIESNDGIFFGTFGFFKDKMALYEGDFVKKTFISENIIKFICEGSKFVKRDVGSMVSTRNDKNPHDEKKRKHDHTITDNSRGELIHEEIHKRGDNFVVTTKGGGRVLGTHATKEKALKQLAAVEISKHSVNEDFGVLLRDRLKSKFFGHLQEEVVNQENEFTMTEPEIAKRDRMADAMLNSPNFHPKLKGKDTKENAAHRIATFKIMGSGRKNSGYEPSLYSHGRDDSAPKRTRKQKRDDARVTMGDEAEEKYNKKVLKTTRKKIPNTNRTTGLSGSSKNVPKNRQKAERQKASRKKVTDRKTFANLKGSDKLSLAAYRKRRLAKNLKSSRYSISK